MTYSSHDHRSAVDRMQAAQAARTAAGMDDDDDLRVVESMAPENHGPRRDRAGTVAFRCELAARHDRSAARTSLLTDGTPPRNPVELARAMGATIPNRAARRAAARQGKATGGDR